MRTIFAVASACLLLCGATVGASANTIDPYVVTFAQVGPNVVATGSGEFDIAGLAVVGPTRNDDGLNGPAPFPYIFVGTPAAPGEYFVSFPADGPSSFGTVSFIDTSLGSGDPAGVGTGRPSSVDWLMVPGSYQSGTVLNGNATFTHDTIASLGLIPGVYVWRWGTDADQTFSLDIVTPTPLPAALPLFATGLGALGLLGWRRKRKAAALAA